jgi:hypothetical protein
MIMREHSAKESYAGLSPDQIGRFRINDHWVDIVCGVRFNRDNKSKITDFGKKDICFP